MRRFVARQAVATSDHSTSTPPPPPPPSNAVASTSTSVDTNHLSDPDRPTTEETEGRKIRAELIQLRGTQVENERRIEELNLQNQELLKRCEEEEECHSKEREREKNLSETLAKELAEIRTEAYAQRKKLVEQVVELTEEVSVLRRNLELVIGTVQEEFCKTLEDQEHFNLELATKICEDEYDNLVSPRLGEITRVRSGALNMVYGETMDPFIDDFLNRTGLDANKTFLDAGCGIGNVVLRVAVKSLSKSIGIELDPVRASIARQYLARCTHRLDQMSIAHGQIEVLEGDLTSSAFLHLFQQSDVIFWPNAKFEGVTSLQDFQDQVLPTLMKAGAYVVMTVPLPGRAALAKRRRPRHRKLVERERRKVGDGWLSWKGPKENEVYGIYQAE
ncbi:hypothetical protein JCM5350_008089 [Sporobolomyces pararoseus]